MPMTLLFIIIQEKLYISSSYRNACINTEKFVVVSVTRLLTLQLVLPETSRHALRNYYTGHRKHRFFMITNSFKFLLVEYFSLSCIE